MTGPRAGASRRAPGGLRSLVGPSFGATRRARTLLAVLGVFAASLVVGTSATVGYGLATAKTALA